jgi:hypothetical protein
MSFLYFYIYNVSDLCLGLGPWPKSCNGIYVRHAVMGCRKVVLGCRIAALGCRTWLGLLVAWVARVALDNQIELWLQRRPVAVFNSLRNLAILLVTATARKRPREHIVLIYIYIFKDAKGACTALT